MFHISPTRFKEKILKQGLCPYSKNNEWKYQPRVYMILEYRFSIPMGKKVEFNIIIVDNNYIHELNKNYRGIDRETDVISFALEDDKTFNPEERVLGDIYISLDKATSQALEYGHSLTRELCFLSVHGLLHLLGYDHMNSADEKIMFSLQDKILEEAGITR